jgi:glutathione S-transferase
MAVERTLHHFPLDPFSREVRLVLGEKRLRFNEVVERYWERPEGLAALNPSGLPPVLIETRPGERLVICEARAILEYLDERYSDPALLSNTDVAERVETRRLLQWFDRKFDYDVNSLLLHEKMEKSLLRAGAPDLAALRAGRQALRQHMAHLEGLLGERDWLAGRQLSLADMAAGAHLSVIDYFGECPWEAFPATRLWYARLKSRPCFRPLLGDRFPGLSPAPHYDDLDF